MGSLFRNTREAAQRAGISIGESYAKQGKSWEEIESMPSSGSGPFSGNLRSGVKTGYDNYMTNNKPASVSTSSANMIQSPGGSAGGLAASVFGTAPQPTSAPGAQNPVADSTGFGSSANGLGGVFNNGQGLASSGIIQPWAQYQSQYGVPNGTNEYNIMDGVKLI